MADPAPDRLRDESDKGERQFHGSVTLIDGSRRALSSDEAAAMWAETERTTAERAAKLPDEKACLGAMIEAYQRLKELGWRDAIYCPKDGTIFDAIEAGSTGIFPCHYDGDWPNGSWWAEDAGDLWPSRPILFRLRS